VTGEEPPHEKTEGKQTAASARGSRCIECGGLSTAARAVQAEFVFPFYLVAFDECDRGGKDRRESQKQSGDARSPLLTHQARRNRNYPSKTKPNHILVPPCLVKSGDISADQHLEPT
jgi:hypothetical protein